MRSRGSVVFYRESRSVGAIQRMGAAMVVDDTGIAIDAPFVLKALVASWPQLPPAAGPTGSPVLWFSTYDDLRLVDFSHGTSITVSSDTSPVTVRFRTSGKRLDQLDEALLERVPPDKIHGIEP